jgi:hypothetical protein
MNKIILIVCLTVSGLTAKSQVELPISEDGVVKYSFDYNEKNSKFCVSKLFSSTNFSEYTIMMQKVGVITMGLSWNESIKKNFSIFCLFIPQTAKSLQCIDTAVLLPHSISISATTIGTKKFKATIGGESTQLNNISITMNCKIYFKSNTEYTVVISDVYMSYSVFENRQVVNRRFEIGELYKEYQSSTSKDQNVEVLLQLLDGAAKNMANALSKAVHESVVFLN